MRVHQACGSGGKQSAVCNTISITHCGSMMPLSSSLLSCPHLSLGKSGVRLQGVRIDYALCTPGLLPKVVSCELDNLPPKWSDHAALLLGERTCLRHPLLLLPAEISGVQMCAASACRESMAESAALKQEGQVQCNNTTDACFISLLVHIGQAAAAYLSCVRAALPTALWTWAHPISICTLSACVRASKASWPAQTRLMSCLQS